MNDILKTYNALSSSSPRSEVSDVLNSIVQAPPFTFDRESRTEVIKAILQDLKNHGSKAKLTSKDAALALLAVKTLGKDPSGSAFLATSSNLSTLLGFASTFKDDQEATCEALRCIANALLLVEGARSTFINKEVNGGDVCLTILEKSTQPDPIFILSRILFLSTASGPSYLETMVDAKFHGRTVVEILGSKLDLMTASFRNSTPVAKEAIVDVLKFVFNLVLHYPKMVAAEPQHSDIQDEKVIGDFWSPKLDGLLPPLLRTFANLPPTSPSPVQSPLTYVIHALITIPVNSSLKPIWLGQASSSGRNSTSSSPKTRSPHDSVPVSRSDSPTRSSQTNSPIISTLDRALSSVLSAGRRSLSRTSSREASYPPIDILQRAYELFDQSFAYYIPGDIDVDHISVRDKAKAETKDTLDAMLGPLVVLITRLCLGDDASKARVRQWIIPDDLDRTSPLEQRPDILGRCLRLLSCVYHPQLKDACGELLYALADCNATTLSALVGYGNVAGFLFHKGVMSAPPIPNESSSSHIPTSTTDGAPINPITGIAEQPKPPLPEMSEEEKEREMEKLFVLFDRLEKTGALPKENNPIRKAIHEGKLG